MITSVENLSQIGFADTHEAEGVDLALDSQDRLRIAFWVGVERQARRLARWPWLTGPLRRLHSDHAVECHAMRR